ncbi:MAG TPA: hypothetical protein VFL57_15650 [Bryobacteraceae bacterium]|nr:hypothetical protein [Bryobacteraceae bacterium]
MSHKSKLLAAAAVVPLVWLARVVWDYFDYRSVPHQTIQVQLKLFGAAMYEYHAATGRWPASLDDLARTSLRQRSYVWRQTASTFVFLWPENLKADPKDNSDVLLAYDRGSLFSKLGRVWVCWGDLRTEHMRNRELRDRLAKQTAFPKSPSSVTWNQRLTRCSIRQPLAAPRIYCLS